MKFNTKIILIGIVAIIIQLSILYYLWNLEKIGCKCAMDWRRDYIMAFIVIGLVYLCSYMIYKDKLPLYFSLIFMILGLINIVAVIQYVNKLKDDNCECSESVMRDIMYVIALFNAVMYFFSIAFLSFIALTIYKIRK